MNANANSIARSNCVLRAEACVTHFFFILHYFFLFWSDILLAIQRFASSSIYASVVFIVILVLRRSDAGRNINKVLSGIMQTWNQFCRLSRSRWRWVERNWKFRKWMWMRWKVVFPTIDVLAWEMNTLFSGIKGRTAIRRTSLNWHRCQLICHFNVERTILFENVQTLLRGFGDDFRCSKRKYFGGERCM